MSDTAALNEFITKYQTARNYNSKEIRLTIEEAAALAAALAATLIREVELSGKVINLQDQIMNGVEVKQDGGSF